MASHRLGYEGVLSYKVGGQSGVGDWTAIDNARDVTIPQDAAEADVTTRGSAGYRSTVATIRDVTFEFDILYDPTDPAVIALQAAYHGADHESRIIGLQALDKLDGHGIQADCHITGFTKNEALEEGQTIAVTAKSTSSDTPVTIVEPGP